MALIFPHSLAAFYQTNSLNDILFVFLLSSCVYESNKFRILETCISGFWDSAFYWCVYKFKGGHFVAKCRGFVCKWWLNKETQTIYWNISSSSFGPLPFLVMFGRYSTVGGRNKTPDFLCYGHSNLKQTIADKSPLKHFLTLFHFRHRKAFVRKIQPCTNKEFFVFIHSQAKPMGFIPNTFNKFRFLSPSWPLKRIKPLLCLSYFKNVNHTETTNQSSYGFCVSALGSSVSVRYHNVLCYE